MTDGEVVARVEDGVGIVELDRLAVHNALSRAMVHALTVTLQRMDSDPGVRVVLLASRGRHFAAGSDVKEMASMTRAEAVAVDFSGCCEYQALDLLLTGRTLSATEALQCGLVSRVVAPKRLREEAMAVARRIASLSAPVVQAIKRSVREGLEIPLGAALSLERSLLHQFFDWPDRTEGMRAFIERRQPLFTHRTAGADVAVGSGVRGGQDP